jgi:hypothetical protein
MRRAGLTFVLIAIGGLALFGQSTPSRGAGRAPGTRVATTFTCAADLGTGVKSRRVLCDLLIASAPSESITVPIPSHTGTATLLFDLHNRFAVPVVVGQPFLSYQRHEAVGAVIRPNGVVIGKVASIREFRTVADLFDLIAGGGRPGGVKAVAPGPAEPIRLTLPAGVASVGITGLRLTVRTSTTGPDVYDTPGRPVAIVSNVRVEYRPAR